MKTPPWTVSCHLRNITEGEDRMWASDSRKKSVQEFWLCWEGHKCHVLTGARGKIILDEFSDELNQQGYTPKFEDGKIYMDLTPAQKLKLAEASSPPLPFMEAAAQA